MVNRKGTSTKNAYMNKAGVVNSQPTMLSRRIFHRESAGAMGRLSDVTVMLPLI
jgi:hypothetical protein